LGKKVSKKPLVNINSLGRATTLFPFVKSSAAAIQIALSMHEEAPLAQTGYSPWWSGFATVSTVEPEIFK